MTDIRHLPSEFDERAKPYDTVPSAAIMSATANAINALGESGEVQEFEQGTYWVDGTVGPTGDGDSGERQIYFNNTTIAVGPNVSLDGFVECTDQETGQNGLAGLNDPNDNLPVGEVTKVLFDVTGSARSNYTGSLTLDGGKKDIALIAAANRNGGDGTDVSGIGSTWDKLTLTKAKWGMFGTPLYGQARHHYAGAFVGNIFKRIRMEGSLKIPYLFGGNTCDDLFTSELNVICGLGARSYLFGAAFCFGTGYMNGQSQQDFGFDIQKSHFIFDTLYAEWQFAAPIIARAASWIEGTVKYGGGGSTIFGKKAFIYNDAVSGGGVVTCHDKSGDGKDIQSIIKLKSANASKRNYWVNQPYNEADALPFAMEASGSQVSSKDQLYSFTPDGLKKWTPNSSSAITGAPVI